MQLIIVHLAVENQLILILLSEVYSLGNYGKIWNNYGNHEKFTFELQDFEA